MNYLTVRRNNDVTDSLFRDFFGTDVFGFNDAAKALWNSVNESYVPGFRADVRATENGYEMEAELPGFNKEDLRIEFQQDRLTISAQHNEETEETRKEYIRRERTVRSVSRSFVVKNIDEERVTANYENGILKVALPLQKATDKPNKSIEIQ